MKFTISRTSDRFRSCKPIEGSVVVDSEFYGYDRRTIEIPDLEALVALSEREGDLIINGNTIEIYDDYRE
jgi:hypothetical protein